MDRTRTLLEVLRVASDTLQTVRIVIRKDEAAVLQEEAKRRGITRASYIRYLIRTHQDSPLALIYAAMIGAAMASTVMKES